jgi:hypothetical protein
MAISVNKRLKEKARSDRARDKEAKRQQRKEEKGGRPEPTADGEDPDIAGIVPGPQPLEEWQQ